MAFMVPMEPAAPGWLMMTIFAPSASSSSPAATRVTWSVAPPAAHGTMMLMGLFGFHCACAEAARASAAAATAVFSILMSVSLVLLRQVSQHERGHVLQALGLAARGQQVALENGRQRMPVAQVEVAQAGDRNVQLHRIHAAPELPGARAALQQVAQHGDQRRV